MLNTSYQIYKYIYMYNNLCDYFHSNKHICLIFQTAATRILDIPLVVTEQVQGTP